MNRISKSQLTALMLIGDTFVLFCLSGNICVMTAVGFAIGSIMQLFLALPLARFYERGKTFADCSKPVRLILLLYLLMWGGTMFSMLWKTSSVIYIPYEGTGIWGRLLTGVLVAAVCVYVSSSGIKALARSAVIASGLGAVCIVMVIISAGIQSDLNNIIRPDNSDLLGEILRGFALSGGIGSFTVLLSFTSYDKTDTAVLYFTCKAFLSFVILLIVLVVTGSIMDILDFPVASAAQLSQPFPVQRTDSLFLIVFSVFAVFSVAVQACAAEYIVGTLFSQLSRFRCSLVLIFMITSGLVVFASPLSPTFYAVASLAALMMVPAEALIKRGGVLRREKA